MCPYPKPINPPSNIHFYATASQRKDQQGGKARPASHPAQKVPRLRIASRVESPHRSAPLGLWVGSPLRIAPLGLRVESACKRGPVTGQSPVTGSLLVCACAWLVAGGTVGGAGC